MASTTASEKTLLTRSVTHVWLIGQQLSTLDLLTCCYRLPTVGLVLRRLFLRPEASEIVFVSQLLKCYR